MARRAGGCRSIQRRRVASRPGWLSGAVPPGCGSANTSSCTCRGTRGWPDMKPTLDLRRSTTTSKTASTPTSCSAGWPCCWSASPRPPPPRPGRSSAPTWNACTDHLHRPRRHLPADHRTDQTPPRPVIRPDPRDTQEDHRDRRHGSRPTGPTPGRPNGTQDLDRPEAPPRIRRLTQPGGTPDPAPDEQQAGSTLRGEPHHRSAAPSGRWRNGPITKPAIGNAP